MGTISAEKEIRISAKDIVITTDSLIISFEGKEYQFPSVSLSKSLSQATAEQRCRFQLSPSGYGIHWPEIDEDLSVPALIKSQSGK